MSKFFCYENNEKQLLSFIDHRILESSVFIDFICRFYTYIFYDFYIYLKHNIDHNISVPFLMKKKKLKIII